MSISRLCVFCGSASGANGAYAAVARTFGAILARRKITLVYGGGRVGLMGAIADAALSAGGQVIGVIPRLLARKEIAHDGLTELIQVETMHERKAKMADLADGFVAMPGGMGTFEEFFEILSWAQLGIHAKPCGLLNAARYYDPLISLLDHAVEQQFLKPEHRTMILVGGEGEALLEKMQGYVAPAVEKWIGRGGEIDADDSGATGCSQPVADLRNTQCGTPDCGGVARSRAARPWCSSIAAAQPDFVRLCHPAATGSLRRFVACQQ